MSSSPLRLGVIAAFAVAVGIFAGKFLLEPPPVVEISSGTLLNQPRPILDFTLTDGDGKPFTKARFNGHVTVVFPGFTFCPDVCPTTMATLKAVHEKLGDAAAKVQIVMVSVDPERDTPAKLGAYVHAFSPDFTGITGSFVDLEELGGSIGFVYSKVTGATPETYTIDHSVAMSLIGPDGRLIGYFTPPYKVDAMVSDLREIVAKQAKAS